MTPLLVTVRVEKLVEVMMMVDVSVVATVVVWTLPTTEVEVTVTTTVVPGSVDWLATCSTKSTLSVIA